MWASFQLVQFSFGSAIFGCLYLIFECAHWRQSCSWRLLNALCSMWIGFSCMHFSSDVSCNIRFSFIRFTCQLYHEFMQWRRVELYRFDECTKPRVHTHMHTANTQLKFIQLDTMQSVFFFIFSDLHMMNDWHILHSISYVTHKLTCVYRFRAKFAVYFFVVM